MVKINDTRTKTKQQQFNAAMERYNSSQKYVNFGKIIATLNVTLQLLLLYQLSWIHLGFGNQVLAFILAYIIADFLNGIVHMIMDHNENYTSSYGPLVAHFHLHHQTPMYTKRPLLVVYFNESGAKIWLVPFQVVVLLLLLTASVSPLVAYILVLVSILSSVAEVSHYLCHTSNSSVAEYLARAGLLLSRKHHTPHHDQDNTNYAFLNGVSDPLINRIAGVFYPGYKSTTDIHFARYAETETGHR